MTHHRLIGAGLSVALVAGLPGAIAAQDQPVTPEGVDWTLTSYLDEQTAEVVGVPLGLQPTLRLQDGTASGLAGCNQFSGGYELDGSSLRFSEEMGVTLALCEPDAQAVEDAYLAALGQTDGWLIDAGALKLSDGFGDVILTFEVPDIMLTTSQLSGLVATLDGLRTEIDDLTAELVTLRDDMQAQNVDRLRERIKALESDNSKLQQRVDALEENPQPTARPGNTVSFSKAEKILLEGVPKRIESYCSPLRSSLPKGTRAAVTCQPNTSAVADINYYLMEGDDAAAVYASTMSTFNVPQAVSSTQTCEQGVKSQRQWVGGGWQADGCYRTNQRAEVRFIENATECRKLTVGGKTLPSPAFYIEVQGSDSDVERVYQWATKGLGSDAAQLSSLIVPIKRPDAGWSPSCPR